MDNNTTLVKMLFLDDERSPSDVFWVNYPTDINEVVVVRTVGQFVEALLTNKFKYLSFDNDLGTKLEGVDAIQIALSLFDSWASPLQFLEEKPICFVHSKNPIAAQRIKNWIELGREHVTLG